MSCWYRVVELPSRANSHFIVVEREGEPMSRQFIRPQQVAVPGPLKVGDEVELSYRTTSTTGLHYITGRKEAS